MKKTLKVILFVFLGLVALGVISRLTGAKAAGKEAVAQTSNNDSAEAELKKTYTYSAEQLMAEYMGNEIRADETFKGKEFWVTGTIKDIGKDILDKSYITLNSADPIRSVQCYVNDKQALSALEKGAKVTVKGTCKGLMVNVLMKDCKIVPN
ncbi:hypothetical protein Q4E93_05750 [Flavitalea sp. BT771]|uniref:OB-fold protein n=1 Tax=Flavitalea sp. BT771 TaxID=3063329 RepID=UPI0026E2CF74|nr:hypothetical protein [Flavitalea sp. BT771]MDO6430078.1 hypothetical protein [Flavitalea sp. BT771]MDV6219783.1 hypothetical protein [Flavitalea sp. BT771]